VTGVQTCALPIFTVRGDTYERALDKLNYVFLKNLWSDGLPILPPTDERVNRLLSGTDIPRDELLG
jgi:hypothetical protein